MSRQRRLDREHRFAPLCALCHVANVVFRGFFIPDAYANVLIGAPPGKTRCVGYFLCRPCSELPDVGQRVEDKLLRELAVPERN